MSDVIPDMRMVDEVEVEQGEVRERPGLEREMQAVLTLYITTLLSGYTMGFSAVAVPDIKAAVGRDTGLLPSLQADTEELSWFGE